MADKKQRRWFGAEDAGSAGMGAGMIGGDIYADKMHGGDRFVLVPSEEIARKRAVNSALKMGGATSGFLDEAPIRAIRGAPIGKTLKALAIGGVGGGALAYALARLAGIKNKDD